MKRFLSLLLCFAILIATPTSVDAKVNSIVARYTEVNFADKRIPNLKSGSNVVTVKWQGAHADRFNKHCFRFVAPKNGTYVFKFSGLKSSSITYPIIDFDVMASRKVSESYLDYSEVELTGFDDGFNYIRLLSPRWASDLADPDVLEDLQGSHHMDTGKITVPLKKGSCLIFSVYDVNEIINEFGHEEQTFGKVKFNVKVKRI